MQIGCKIDATQETQRHSRADSRGVKEWDWRYQIRLLMRNFDSIDFSIPCRRHVIVQNERFRTNANTVACACSIDVPADIVEA